jgi:uncharacterized protein (TIGR01777 family)
MRFVLAGGTGFFGHAICQRLTGQHDIVVLSRGDAKAQPPGTRVVSWSPDGSSGEWAREIDGADVVMNLTGAGLADRRWSDARKRVLVDSRVLPTRSLAAAIQAARHKPRVFIQTSACGIYGAFEDGRQTFDEQSPAGADFLAQLCVRWEAEAAPITAAGVRLVIMRNGVVLSRTGGALPRMVTPFYFLAGGPVAAGRQYMSWITLNDWVRMTMWAVENANVRGAINATAPNPVPSKEFAQAIGHAVSRPSWIPVPAFVLRLLFGEMAQNILILGQRVIPKRALEMGFKFDNPAVDEAVLGVLTRTH